MDTRIATVLMSFQIYNPHVEDHTGLCIIHNSPEAFSDGELKVIVNSHGEVKIDNQGRGKEFFLDLMSKLYDMAEVK